MELQEVPKGTTTKLATNHIKYLYPIYYSLQNNYLMKQDLVSV